MQLVLTFPITSNEAERSFSQLKLLLSSGRSTMTDKRWNNLVLMAAHRARLDSISNDFVIAEFEKKPRKTDFGSKLVFVDTSDSESDEGNLGMLFILFSVKTQINRILLVISIVGVVTFQERDNKLMY